MATPQRDPATAEDLESHLRRLWSRAQEGDEEAYRASLTCMAGRLRAYLRRRLQAWPDEVEDLVQEVLLALHLQRGTWEPTLPVTAWMYAIARHKLIDWWRRHGRRGLDWSSIDEIEEHEQPSRDDGDCLIVRRDLRSLLDAIPPAQREAIVLTKLEGLSLAEASARTGASVAALKVQVHRGLKRLADLVRTRP